MDKIIAIVGFIVWQIFQLSLIVGCVLIFVYVLVNIFYNSRLFYKASRFVKQITYTTINITKIWGPNCLIFYLLGSLLIQIINFF